MTIPVSYLPFFSKFGFEVLAKGSPRGGHIARPLGRPHGHSSHAVAGVLKKRDYNRLARNL
jgi:hypothetical protein